MSILDNVLDKKRAELKGSRIRLQGTIEGIVTVNDVKNILRQQCKEYITLGGENKTLLNEVKQVLRYCTDKKKLYAIKDKVNVERNKQFTKNIKLINEVTKNG